jgi:hypothetical protein
MEDHLQRGYLAAVGLADHNRRVAERQDGAHVVQEFDGARAVDEGELIGEVLGGGDVGLDRHLVRAGFRRGVADAGAARDLTRARDRAGACEQCLEQGRLSALEGADDGDGHPPAALGGPVAFSALV